MGICLRQQHIEKGRGPKLANCLDVDVVCNEIADLLSNKMKERASNRSLRVNHVAPTQ
jgi:hypothetical protein